KPVGTHRRDTDIDLALSLDLRPDLEFRSAADHFEAGPGGIDGGGERGIEREIHVQIAGPHRRDGAFDAGLRAVDAYLRILSFVLAVEEAAGDGLDADELIRPIGRARQAQRSTGDDGADARRFLKLVDGKRDGAGGGVGGKRKLLVAID